MKQILSVIIEIESNNTHSVRNIEEALNFYWGSNGTFKVTESRPTPRALDVCPSCAGKGTYQIGVYSETCSACHGTGTRQ